MRMSELLHNLHTYHYAQPFFGLTSSLWHY